MKADMLGFLSCFQLPCGPMWGAFQQKQFLLNVYFTPCSAQPQCLYLSSSGVQASFLPKQLLSCYSICLEQPLSLSSQLNSSVTPSRDISLNFWNELISQLWCLPTSHDIYQSNITLIHMDTLSHYTTSFRRQKQ